MSNNMLGGHWCIGENAMVTITVTSKTVLLYSDILMQDKALPLHCRGT